MTGVIYNPKSIKLYSFPRSFSEKSRTRDRGRKIPLTQRKFLFPILQRNTQFSTNTQERISTNYIEQTKITNSTVFAYSYHMDTNNRVNLGN